MAGTLACRSCEIPAAGTTAQVEFGAKMLRNQANRRQERIVVTLEETLHLAARDELRIAART